MRIIGGKKRGLKLQSPDGDAVRPTSDRMREGLFNILSGAQYRGAVAGADAVIADVFAGTGAMGLEAWSRFAARVVFIENNPAALACIKTNIARAGLHDDMAAILPRDATRRLHWPSNMRPASLLFVDPPWQNENENEKNNLAITAIENLIAIGAVAQGAVISIEHDAKNPPAAIPQSCSKITTRNWGRGAATLLRHDGD